MKMDRVSVRAAAAMIVALTSLSAAQAQRHVSPVAGLDNRQIIDLAAEYQDGRVGHHLSQCRTQSADTLVAQRGQLLASYTRYDAARRDTMTRVRAQASRTLVAFGNAFLDLQAEMTPGRPGYDDVVALNRDLLSEQIEALIDASERVDLTRQRTFASHRTFGRSAGLSADIELGHRSALDEIGLNDDVRASLGRASSVFQVATSIDPARFAAARQTAGHVSAVVSVITYYEEVRELTVLLRDHANWARLTESARRGYAYFELCVRFSRLDAEAARRSETEEAIERARNGIDTPVQIVTALPSEVLDAAQSAREGFQRSCIVDCACVQSVVDRETESYRRALYDFLRAAPARTVMGMIACQDLMGRTDFASSIAGRSEVPDYSRFLSALRRTSEAAVAQCPNLTWVDSSGRPSVSCWAGGTADSDPFDPDTPSWDDLDDIEPSSGNPSPGHLDPESGPTPLR